MFDRGKESGLSLDLARAALLLRATPEPRDAWRLELLQQVDAMPRPRRVELVREPRPERNERRFAMRPVTAIAAGLLCAIVGGATVALVTREGAPAPAIALSQPRVRFRLDAPNAARVYIVGDFNGWNPTSLPLRRSSDGRTWEVEVPLAPGRYAYSFMVDGALAPDPAAPRSTDDDFGTPNSILMVKGS